MKYVADTNAMAHASHAFSTRLWQTNNLTWSGY